MPLVEIDNGYRTGTINVNGEIHEIKPGADLSGADLHGANLSGVDLISADLSGTDLSYADLSGADLTGANLTGADLRNADLHGAHLNWADLRGAHLFGTDFRDADLVCTDFRDADLRYANLQNANLAEANLAGADLTDVRMRHQGWQHIRDNSINVDQAIGIPDLDSRLEQVQSRPVPKGIQKLYENDKCPVCLEDYNGKEKCVMTNCGHLTCMECMQGMVDSGMKLDCPTCRKSFAFGSSFGVVISKRNNPI
jgi:hypothetical protein